MLSPLLRRYTWNSAWLYNARIFIALCRHHGPAPWWLGECSSSPSRSRLGVVAAALTDLDDRLTGRLRNLGYHAGLLLHCLGVGGVAVSVAVAVCYWV